jgi:hypothetical protein
MTTWEEERAASVSAGPGGAGGLRDDGGRPWSRALPGRGGGACAGSARRSGCPAPPPRWLDRARSVMVPFAAVTVLTALVVAGLVAQQ